MFFKNKSSRVILLGLNEISLNLMKRFSRSYELVVLAAEAGEIANEAESDVLIAGLEDGLLAALKSFQASEADCLLAVTGDDEYNLLAAALARRLGVKRTAALVKEVDYTDIYLDIDLIFNPYQIIIDRISTIIKETRLQSIRNLIPGRVNLGELVVKNEDPFSYLKIKNIKLEGCLIIAVNRSEKFIMPDAELKLFPGDKLFIIYKRGMINQLLKLFRRKRVNKRLFISGGSELALALIDAWQNVFESLVVIEPELERCNTLAERLENTLILQGDGTDIGLLREEGLDQKGIFLAAGRNDLENILSSFAARETGCRQVITLLNKSRYQEIAELLKLPCLLNLPDIIGEQLTAFIKTGLNINRSILGGDIYLSEFSTAGNSRLRGKKIRELNLPAGVIIGVIIRGGTVIVPAGEDSLDDGDELVIFYNLKQEQRVYNIFKGRGT